MKFLVSVFIAAIIFSSFIFLGKIKLSIKIKSTISKPLVKKVVLLKETMALKTYAAKIKPYLNANNYCQEYCFLINMKLPSGKKRFFIYNLKNDSIMEAGLVTHGGGSETGTDKLKFSNVPNSGATSIGKYKIGNEYNGKFGMAFKLYGLEASNSKAFERFVVLHSHSCVPTNETVPFPICTSLGCPTVSPTFLPILKKYIDKADNPVVLWIYY